MTNWSLLIILTALSLGCITTSRNSASYISVDTTKVIPNPDHTINTNKAISVDTHGRPLDTDRDGVPDYRDKELLTLQKCFPADSNGIGHCPEPACCHDFDNVIVNDFSCNIGFVETSFNKKSYAQTVAAGRILDSMGLEMKMNPAKH